MRFRTTLTQDKEFINSVIPSSFLEDAVTYIKSEFTAEELFGRDILEEWTLENGFVKEE